MKAKIENKCDSPPDAVLETQLRETFNSFLNLSVFPSYVSGANKGGVSHTYLPSEKKRKLCLVETSVRSQKVDVNVSVPWTHQIIHRTKLAAVLAKAEKYDALCSSLTRKCYQGSKLGNRLFGTAAAMVHTSRNERRRNHRSNDNCCNLGECRHQDQV